MTAIEQEEDIQQYKSLFGEMWESAVVRVSVIKLGDETAIPNGEIIFSKEAAEGEQSVLYKEGPFKITERTVTEPFSLIENLAAGEFTEARGVEIGLLKHNPEQRFVGNRDSRVFDPRPQSEIHGVFSVDLSKDTQSEYNDLVDDLQDRLQRSSEPFYDVAKAEYYYFKHHFRRSRRADPELLVFSDPGIDFDIDEDDGLSVVVPEEIIDETAVSILPQRPYGKGKGWRTELSNTDLEEIKNGQVEYRDNLDLPDIEEAFIILFVGEEILEFEEFYNPDAVKSDLRYANPRYGVLNEYDQRDQFLEHLQRGDSDIFEIAVQNLFSIAGYQVQWFGESQLKIPNFDRRTSELEYDEIDVIAHRPDGSQILFIECTVQGIADKNDLLDRVGKLSAAIGVTESQNEKIDIFETNRRKVVPVIATSMSQEKLSPQVVDTYNENGVAVLANEDLVGILETASKQSEPVNIEIVRDNLNLDAF